MARQSPGAWQEGGIARHLAQNEVVVYLNDILTIMYIVEHVFALYCLSSNPVVVPAIPKRLKPDAARHHQ
jgi:hypothetical protein